MKANEIDVTLPIGDCPSEVGNMNCTRKHGHESPHQCWSSGRRGAWPFHIVQGKPELIGQWFDCPGGHPLCGGAMSTAEKGVMGECGLCWSAKQPKCPHGNIKGGYCSACDADDAAKWREHVRGTSR